MLVADLAKGVAVAAISGGIVHGAHAWADREQPDPVDSVVDSLTGEEGFRSKPYRDTRGYLSLGYGTNLDVGITKEQAEAMLRVAVKSTLRDLRRRWEPFDSQPLQVQVRLLDAAYQLGVDGLLSFHKMLAAIEAGEWETAAKEALASKWDAETPKRAEALARVLREQI